MNAAEKRYQEALAALNARRFADAETQFRRFLKDHPSHVGALNLLTITLMSMQRFAEAEPVIARAVKLNQGSDVSFYNYGLILKQLGKPKEAVAQFNQALRLNPSVPDTWNNRGAARNDIGHYQDALADFDRAIALGPDNAAAYANKGRAFGALQRYDEALAACDKALALNPRLAEAWVGRGAALAALDRSDEAFAAYDQALAVDPTLADAYAGIGNTLRDMGRIEEAREAYRKAAVLAPTGGEFFNLYTGVGKVSADEPLLATMEALSANETASPIDRMCADFALGKAYADIGDHERAFFHWLSGNALKRRQIDYDAAAAAAQFADVEGVFTPALIEVKRGNGDPSTLPIFVLGMPRSGTTLVEQILSSHPAVHGAGELGAFGGLLDEAVNDTGSQRPYPHGVTDLDGAAIHDIGARYVAALAKLAPEAARVTDKLPANFLYIGAIHLALPNAKIVHTVRNPVDTCLSCFSHL
ncbi:MAG: tetratricopeptide repeat protein, partial [Pseudolabrys sp.]